jgi:protein Mpv17
MQVLLVLTGLSFGCVYLWAGPFNHSKREQELDTMNIRADLDETTLGKSSRLAIPTRTHASLRTRPPLALQRRSVAALEGTLNGAASPSLPRPEGRPRTVSAYAAFHGDFALNTRPDDIKAALSMISHLPASSLSWYHQEVLQYPLMTKAMTSGVCYSVGDFCAQRIDGKNTSTLDLSRLARSGAAGFVGQGPLAHYYLNWLDQYMSFGGAWWAVPAKIAIDQGPMNIVENTMYSLLMGAFALRDPREVLKDVKATFVPGLVASIRFWPAVHMVTFTVIPLELQVLWADVAEIVWICIFSGVSNEMSVQQRESVDQDASILRMSELVPALNVTR